MLTEQVRRVSDEPCKVLGLSLEIYEIKVQLAGRSRETHRLRNKAICEGYKFFVLEKLKCCIYCKSPSNARDAEGRRICENKLHEQNQYEIEKSNIVSMIKSLENPLMRVSTTDESALFVVTMKNCFTLEHVMFLLASNEIRTVGTA